MPIGITVWEANNAIHMKIIMLWHIFLKDLQRYWTDWAVKDSPGFSRECQDYSQPQHILNILQNCKDYSWAMKNSTLVKMGALLNKMKNGLVLKQ